MNLGRTERVDRFRTIAVYSSLPIFAAQVFAGIREVTKYLSVGLRCEATCRLPFVPVYDEARTNPA